MIRVVGIGGGTGLSVLLRGMKMATDCRTRSDPDSSVETTAIVCVSDNGGSSGLLRRSFGIPAVGDLRNCLAAMSDDRSVLPDLFQYRFASGDGLAGHSLGNLILSALCLMSGSVRFATAQASSLLGITGRVFPATELPVSLCARMCSGEIVRGEVEIAAARKCIQSLRLEPECPPPCEGVLDAIAAADVIVLGPGSLFTSIVPSFLVAGIAEAVRCSPAPKIFACNLMTQPGESDRFTAADHLRVLEQYLGRGIVDVCLMNSRPVKPQLLGKYWNFGSELVCADPEEIGAMGIQISAGDLLETGTEQIRHDAGKLAETILSLAREPKRVGCHWETTRSLVA